MKNIIIILARKNSKRIKNKNIKKIKGKPLITYTIENAKKSKLVDSIHVSSDSLTIKKITEKNKIDFIKRPANLCKPNSKSEDAILHATSIISKYKEINYVVFLQPTSPIRKNNDIDNCIKKLKNSKSDSLFSSSSFRGHIWKISNDKIKPINYNYKNRKMDQYKNDQIIENGSIYVFKYKGFLRSKNRLFGKIINYPMSAENSFQVDESIDLKIINSLIKVS